MEEIKLNVQGKVLEVNKKAIEDSINFFKGIDEDHVKTQLDNLSKKSQDDLDHIAMVFLPKGKKIWLEVTVEDSYMSSLLFRWLHGQGRPHLIGCSLDSIHFSIPSEFTEGEKLAIRELYKRVIGE